MAREKPIKLEEKEKFLTTIEATNNLAAAKSEYLLQYEKYLEMKEKVKREKSLTCV